MDCFKSFYSVSVLHNFMDDWVENKETTKKNSCSKQKDGEVELEASWCDNLKHILYRKLEKCTTKWKNWSLGTRFSALNIWHESWLEISIVGIPA